MGHTFLIVCVSVMVVVEKWTVESYRMVPLQIRFSPLPWGFALKKNVIVARASVLEISLRCKLKSFRVFSEPKPLPGNVW